MKKAWRDLVVAKESHCQQVQEIEKKINDLVGKLHEMMVDANSNESSFKLDTSSIKKSLINVDNTDSETSDSDSDVIIKKPSKN